MPDLRPADKDFITRITAIIEENISDEQFGVSELANAIGMSRSNLLRKISKLTGLSASQFIRRVRLENAMVMLKDSSYNISEIGFKVGFNSTSYFIKCFRELYGYPPGEVARNESELQEVSETSPPVPPRQLAAIMFTDIQGYTALMQKDESRAVEYRNRHREVFNAAIAKFNGKILQYYGDGTLSTFSSAIDAVRCGIEMQLAFREEPAMPVRVGINSGDIIFTEDDIIGDGVNVASRIESLAVAGSVFISGKVYDEVKNQVDITTVAMGVFKLKNVDRPVEVFAVANEGLVVPDPQEVGEKPGPSSKDAAGRPTGWIKWAALVLVTAVLAYLVFGLDIFGLSGRVNHQPAGTGSKKSIAVLPFINDSDDSSNVYIINGLMESILNNLQKIEGLRVISRTSVEKYRNNPKLISDIARELNVDYVVEGSGQKIGGEISLSIQLIEAPNDKHLWSGQYIREAKDIFTLQSDVAKSIADQVQVIITPEEEERIDKIPTQNLAAYDLFLKGLDLFYQQKYRDAIPLFKMAIQQDSLFARAYADIALSYAMMDIFQVQKIYSDSINYYADQALLHDPQLPYSLAAKALFFMNNEEYGLAVPYLEKGLQYNPNSDVILNILSSLYANIIPDTEKYLKYALKGIRLNIASYDSNAASNIYLHVSNSFIQSGFVEEAEYYINKSLDYNPFNIYSDYVKAYILYARDRDLSLLRTRLAAILQKDTTRLDVLQEVGKACYYLRDYEQAYRYYSRYLDIEDALNMDIFPGEKAKIALVYSRMGLEEEARKLLLEFKSYAEYDHSIYKHLSLAAYYAYLREQDQALANLELFSQQHNYHYWIILYLEVDPLMDPIKDRPEFKRLVKKLEKQFWEYHRQVKTTLENENLI